MAKKIIRKLSGLVPLQAPEPEVKQESENSEDEKERLPSEGSDYEDDKDEDGDVVEVDDLFESAKD